MLSYNGLRKCVFHLSHTHTLQIRALLVMGWQKSKKNNKSVGRRDGFSNLTEKNIVKKNA